MAKSGTTPELEKAMADALKSVERIERDREGDESVGGADEIEVVESADAPEEGPAAPEPAAAQTAPTEDSADGAALKEQLLRMAADFENFRKRSRKDRVEQQKFAAEAVFRDLLPVVDNLERALAHAAAEDAVAQGVGMVAKQFLDILGTHGVVPFQCDGEVFDPEFHEAVGQAPSEDIKPGCVMQEMEKGYKIHERLLRPAKVIVAIEASAPKEPG